MFTSAQRSNSSSITATTELRSFIRRQIEESKRSSQDYFINRSQLFCLYPTTKDGVPAQGPNPWHIYLSEKDLEFRDRGVYLILKLYEDEALGADNFFIFRQKHHDAADEFGQTPLHLAIENPCVGSKDYSNEILRLIVYLVRGVPAKGRREAILPCNFNAQTLTGDTPAHLAVRSTLPRSIEIISILGDAGADFNIKNNEGHAPLTLLLSESLKESQYLIGRRNNDPPKTPWPQKAFFISQCETRLERLVSKMESIFSRCNIDTMFNAFPGAEKSPRSNMNIAIEVLANILEYASSSSASRDFQCISKSDSMFYKLERIIAKSCQQFFLTGNSPDALVDAVCNLMIFAVFAKDRQLVQDLKDNSVFLETNQHRKFFSLFLSATYLLENTLTEESAALQLLVLARKDRESDIDYGARLSRVFQGDDNQVTILHEMVACGERVALVGVLLDCFERVPMSVQLDLLNARDAGGKRPLALLAHNRDQMPQQYGSNEWGVIEQRLQAIEAKFRLKQEPYARTKVFFSALWYGVLWLISLPLMLFSNPDNFHTQVEGKWRHYVRDRLDPPLVLPPEISLAVSVGGDDATVDSSSVVTPACVFTPQYRTPIVDVSPTPSLGKGNSKLSERLSPRS